MSDSVHKFIMWAKPASDHPEYYQWQTGVLCVLIGEDSHWAAEQLAIAEVTRRKWEPLQMSSRSTLIEAKVREAGEPIWSAFCAAKAGNPQFIEKTDEIVFTRKGGAAPTYGPRLSERFIDSVVESAGGRRLTFEEGAEGGEPNADYVIADAILELKDLQTEALEVATRQQRLVEQMWTRGLPGTTVFLSPAELTSTELRDYLAIVGAPVRKRLLRAGKQVRHSLQQVPDARQGGVIILNTGYGSLPHELLDNLVQDFVAQSNTLSIGITISAWSLCNGFDTTLQFEFSPRLLSESPVAEFRAAFDDGIEELMNVYARSGFVTPEDPQTPLHPIAFEGEERLFVFRPPKPPTSVPWPTRKA